MVHQSSELYGSDRSFLSSCKAMKSQGYEVTVLLPTYGPLYEELSKFCSEIIIKDFGVLRKTTLRKSPLIEGYKLFKGLIYALSLVRIYDAVYINTIVNVTFIIAVRFFTGLKVIHVREMPLGLTNSFFRFLIKFSRADLVFNSLSVKKAFCLEGDVVYNGVEVDCSDQNSSCLLNKLNKKIKILFVGRLNDWKGADLLLQACKNLDDKNLISEINILGDCFPGQEVFADELEDIAKCIDHISVNFLGFLQDTSSLYSKCDLVVVPSKKPEPFGRVVIEGMAHEKCVLIANHGGMAELVSDEINGFVFEPNSVSSLTKKIEEIALAPHLRKTVAKNALDSYRKNYTESAYMQNITLLFNKSDNRDE